MSVRQTTTKLIGVCYVFNNIYHNNYMFRPLMLAIIRLFNMNTYQLVIQVLPN
jgi:hypothetical protein